MCSFVCVLQVRWGLSTGQAAVVPHSGPGEPYAAPRLPLLRGQGTGGTMPALLQMHEVSPHQTEYKQEDKRTAGRGKKLGDQRRAIWQVSLSFGIIC